MTAKTAMKPKKLPPVFQKFKFCVSPDIQSIGNFTCIDH